jgi:AbrB family looped-hinge helix DNA binding protein
MSVLTSKVTTKGQATIPEELREKLSIKPGQRLVWEIEDGKLVALLARDLMELSGSLKSDAPFPGIKGEKEAVRQLRAKGYAKKYRQA